MLGQYDQYIVKFKLMTELNLLFLEKIYNVGVVWPIYVCVCVGMCVLI